MELADRSAVHNVASTHVTTAVEHRTVEIRGRVGNRIPSAQHRHERVVNNVVSGIVRADEQSRPSNLSVMFSPVERRELGIDPTR
jgi:hypothetical protein